jgi:cob(I)alamin adenosyltransferase
MKIYTGQGDRGQTRLPDGPPISKGDPSLEACGTIDELGSAIGLVRAEPLPDEVDGLLEQVQHALFELNSELAHPLRAEDPSQAIGPADSKAIEAAIDRFQAELEPLTQFILAGGTRTAATLHMARTICRRAERRVVALGQSQPDRVTQSQLVYLNRLSDLLFVLARVANARAGRPDVQWRQR